MSNRKHIMVVDDSRIARTSLRQALEGAGHVVVEFASARDALIELQRQPPGLLITDLHMPEMDGLQLVAAARQKNVECPVIVVTTEVCGRRKDQGIRLGVRGWAQKPVDTARLCTAAQLLLEGHGARTHEA